jgi:hypothetical protein
MLFSTERQTRALGGAVRVDPMNIKLKLSA